MRLERYLSDPCRMLSIPYWKAQKFVPPEDIQIIHEADYNDKLLKNYDDESYFRLLHRLSEVKSVTLEGVALRTAEFSDIPQIVEIINRSYEDISVDVEQILSDTKTRCTIRCCGS